MTITLSSAVMARRSTRTLLLGLTAAFVFASAASGQTTPAPTTPAPTTPPSPAVPVPAAPDDDDMLDLGEEEDFELDDTLTAFDSFAVAAPNMIGDFFGGGFAGGGIDTGDVGAPLPLAGGSRRLKIAENNKALTQNRVFFQFNHFNNVIHQQNLNTLVNSSQSLQQYVIGMERAFGCGCWSIDIRLPFTSGAEIVDPAVGFALDAGNLGNLNIALKRMLYNDGCRTVAAGLAINTPTGSDVTGAQTAGGINGTFTLHNDTIRLAPFIGVMLTPNECTFMHAFVQADVATDGNTIDAIVGGTPFTAELDEPSLLYVDLSIGRWLYRDACSGRSLAAIAELHTSTRLDDVTAVDLGNWFFQDSHFRFDNVTHVTAALHADLDRVTDLRVGAVLPISGRVDPVNGKIDRFFDSEIIVQLNRYF